MGELSCDPLEHRKEETDDCRLSRAEVSRNHLRSILIPTLQSRSFPTQENWLRQSFRATPSQYYIHPPLEWDRLGTTRRDRLGTSEGGFLMVTLQVFWSWPWLCTSTFEKRAISKFYPRHLHEYPLCHLWYPQHHTSNCVHALKPDLDQQSFSNDSCHWETHLTWLLRAGSVWWSLEWRPDGLWTLSWLRQSSQMSSVDRIPQWILSPYRCRPTPWDVTHHPLSFLMPPQSLSPKPGKSVQVPEAKSFTSAHSELRSSSEQSSSSHGRNDV